MANVVPAQKYEKRNSKWVFFLRIFKNKKEENERWKRLKASFV